MIQTPGDFVGQIWHNCRDMAFGTKSWSRLLSCLLALLWVMLPVLCTAQCVRTLPLPQAAAPAMSAALPCPMCAKMQMAKRAVPGMAGMKCCCQTNRHLVTRGQMTCRCCVQPAPKLTAALLFWSPLAVLPAAQRLDPPRSCAHTYPVLRLRLCSRFCTPLPRPPRFL